MFGRIQSQPNIKEYEQAVLKHELSAPAFCSNLRLPETAARLAYMAFCLSVSVMFIFSSVTRLSVPVTLIFSAS